ncbi:MAG: DUF4251 domain-containing protein [Bacteroides sp.]|nr:DUF4251 domain-containing protein [Bacteroides sp.]
MKKVILLLCVVSLGFTGCGTTSPEQKAMEKAQQQARYEASVQALKDQSFVIEADRINFKRGRFVYVTANTNFIMVDGTKATIQMAFNSSYAGPNGIGGITVDGTVSGVKMETDKKGNVTYSMMVQGAAVSANVLINLPKGTNQCSATVTPNFSSNRIDFDGTLYPKEESQVFKGRSI